MRSEIYLISLSLGCRDSFIAYEVNPGVPVYNCQIKRQTELSEEWWALRDNKVKNMESEIRLRFKSQLYSPAM